MTYLTAEMLRSKTACEKQVMMFESEWPNGMPLDESVAPRIVDLKLSVNWFAENFLKPAARSEHNIVITPAWDEYKRVKDAARSEYNRVIVAARDEHIRVIASAWTEYERVIVAARSEYNRVIDSAWDEYKRVEAAAWAEYERAKASAAIRIYREQEGK